MKFQALYGYCDRFADVSAPFNANFVKGDSIIIEKDTCFNSSFGDQYPGQIKELIIYEEGKISEFFNPLYVIGENDPQIRRINIQPGDFYNQRTVTTFNHGFKFTIYNNDLMYTQYIKDNIEWKPHVTELLTHLIQPSDIIIDAGAHIGYQTLTLSWLANDGGYVYAFEPQNQNFTLLKKNLDQNNVNNVNAINKALSNVCETVRMPWTNYAVDVNTCDLSIVKTGGNPVQSDKIDNLELPILDFIKIDVQGYESRVLDGARNTITLTKPIILIQINDIKLRPCDTNSNDLVRMLQQDFGYKHIFLVDSNKPTDYLCVPESRYQWFMDLCTAKLVTISDITSSNPLNNTFESGINKKLTLASTNNTKLYNSKFRTPLKIAFHSDQLGLSGTDVAMYNYADHNESLLHNQSFVISRKFNNAHDQFAIHKFKDRFEKNVFFYNMWDEAEEFMEKNQVDVLYVIVDGNTNKKPIMSKRIKTVIHTTNKIGSPYGAVYASVSTAVPGYRPEVPYVPYMITLPTGVTEDLRTELGIPASATVFGYHGSSDKFNIEFVHRIIQQTADKNPNIYFVFLGINNFCNKIYSNIIFINGIADVDQKNKFINTCDAMIHANKSGEAFGQSVGEFAVKGKPVITYDDCTSKEHIKLLNDYAIIYHDADDLYAIFKTFDKNIWKTLPIGKKNNGYSAYTPDMVMKIFKRVFLD